MANDTLIYVDPQADISSMLELVSVAQRIASGAGGGIEAFYACRSGPEVPAVVTQSVDRVVVMTHASLADYTPEGQLAALEHVVHTRAPAAILLSNSTAGLDLAPALALRTGRPLITNCTDLSVDGDSVEAESLIYGGKMRAKSRVKLPAVFTIVAGNFGEAPPAGKMAMTVAEAPPEGLVELRTALVDRHLPASDGPDLTKAEMIICVGRGVGDKGSIDLAREVADAMGAELAGSRPIIDLGWLSKDRQVGKSGRKVKPKLYLALGVSGAPEHIEGMRNADLIVAINTDPRAPIFEVAHYGATCDMLELLPELADRLKQGRA